MRPRFHAARDRIEMGFREAPSPVQDLNLRRTLFGFAPAAVRERVQQFQDELRSLRDELGRQQAERERLQARCEELQRERAAAAEALEGLREREAALARRLVAADEEAARIREEALADAEALRAQWRAEVARAEAELGAVRQTVDAMRRDFLQLLARTAEALSGHGQALSWADAAETAPARDADGVPVEPRRVDAVDGTRTDGLPPGLAAGEGGVPRAGG